MKSRLALICVAVLFLMGGTCQNSGQNVFTQAPAAQKPVIDSVTNNSPAGAPFFQSRDVAFHVPWPTNFEVNIDGYLLQDKTQQGCGDEGCYVVQSQNENPAGQKNYTIRVFPQAYKRRINQIKIGIVDVSLNPSLSGQAAVSEPTVVILLEGIGSTLPGTGPVPGTPEYAARTNRGYLDFLTIGLGDQTEAQAYYQTIDPTQSKLTLKAWKAANGFNPASDSGDDAKAVYFNEGDLGFGRGMHMKKSANGDIAYYVSNYPTVEDARRGSNLIATVGMEYSPLPAGGPPVTKFYVYDNKGTEGGNRILAADLDGDGAKFIPRLCVICHGGKGQPQPGQPAGDLGARFLPFDLASFQYSPVGGSDRTAQEAEFKKLNQEILNTNKSAATGEIIGKWYGGPQLPNATQDSDAVPNGWAGHEGFYRDTVRTSCRSCHITRNAGLDFASFQSFNNLSGLAYTRLCTDLKMPNAKVTYQRFWLERNPSRLQPLLTAGLNGFQPGAVCPN